MSLPAVGTLEDIRGELARLLDDADPDTGLHARLEALVRDVDEAVLVARGVADGCSLCGAGHAPARPCGERVIAIVGVERCVLPVAHAGPHAIEEDAHAPAGAGTEDPLSARAVLTRRWGEDPRQWPAFSCDSCGQRNSGWSLTCGRCGLPREVGP